MGVASIGTEVTQAHTRIACVPSNPQVGSVSLAAHSPQSRDASVFTDNQFVARSLCRSVGETVGRSVGETVGRSVGGTASGECEGLAQAGTDSNVPSLGRSDARSPGRSGRSVTRSLSRWLSRQPATAGDCVRPGVSNKHCAAATYQPGYGYQ